MLTLEELIKSRDEASPLPAAGFWYTIHTVYGSSINKSLDWLPISDEYRIRYWTWGNVHDKIIPCNSMGEALTCYNLMDVFKDEF